MTYYQKDPADFTPGDLRDPLLDAGTLYRVAGQRPDLWPHILRHPQVYPDLAVYIQQGNPDFPPRHHRVAPRPTESQLSLPVMANRTTPRRATIFNHH